MIAFARTLLALVLLAGVYLLVCVMAVICAAGFVVALWSSGLPHATGPNLSVSTFCVGTTPVVATMVWAMARTPAAESRGGPPVARGEASELWECVTDLAERMGAEPPDRIVLTAEANARVVERGTLFGFGPGWRTLHLGLPLVACLPPDELNAVIAHELGHTSGGHGGFGTLARRGHLKLAAARDAVDALTASNRLNWSYAGLPWAMISTYLWMLRSLTNPIRRQQEIEADRAAARITGARTVAEALRSSAALEQAWQEFCGDLLAPARRSLRAVPDDPFQAFACLVREPEFAREFARLRTRAGLRRAHPDDAHPGLETRILRLERLAASARENSDPGTAVRFRPPLRYVHAAARTLDGGRRDTQMPWRSWIDLLSEHHAARVLKPLAHAVEQTEKPPEARDTPPADAADAEPPALGRVLHLLETGRGTALSEALVRHAGYAAEPGSDPCRPLADAVLVLVGTHLVAQGTARWATSHAGRTVLVPPEGTTRAQIRRWTTAAVRRPDETRRLGTRLAAWGIDVGQPPPRTETASRPRREGEPRRDGAGPETRRGRQIRITPDMSASARRLTKSVQAFSLTLGIVLPGVCWLIWAHRDPIVPPGGKPHPIHRPTTINPIGGGNAPTPGARVPIPGTRVGGVLPTIVPAPRTPLLPPVLPLSPITPNVRPT